MNYFGSWFLAVSVFLLFGSWKVDEVVLFVGGFDLDYILYGWCGKYGDTDFN